MKDVDSAARSRFLKVAFWIFPTTGFLGFFIGLNMYGKPSSGLLIGIIAGFIASCITYIIIEYFGSSGVNLLYGKRRPVYSDFEKFEGEIHQAQYQKSKNEYHKALVMVDGILKKAPNLPEALYLKAQILWEGYHKAVDAIAILDKLLVVLPDKNQTYHRWAETLIADINSEKTSV